MLVFRLQLPSKVFISQDIYGMDMSKTDPANTNTNNNNNEMEETTEANDDDSPEENAPLNGGELDEDSMECVICLTDPREVFCKNILLLGISQLSNIMTRWWCILVVICACALLVQPLSPVR